MTQAKHSTKLKSSKTTPVEGEGKKMFRLPETNDFPLESIERLLVDHIKRSGLAKSERMVKVFLGGMITCQMIYKALHVLKNPADPENNWKVLVERVFIDGEVYLRLVRELPRSVKDQWTATGRAPEVVVVWGTPDTSQPTPKARPSAPPPEASGVQEPSEAPRTDEADKPIELSERSRIAKLYLEKYLVRKTPRRDF